MKCTQIWRNHRWINTCKISSNICQQYPQLAKLEKTAKCTCVQTMRPCETTYMLLNYSLSRFPISMQDDDSNLWSKDFRLLIPQSFKSSIAEMVPKNCPQSYKPKETFSMYERCNWLPKALDRNSNSIAVEPFKPSSLHQFINANQISTAFEPQSCIQTPSVEKQPSSSQQSPPSELSSDSPPLLEWLSRLCPTTLFMYIYVISKTRYAQG